MKKIHVNFSEPSQQQLRSLLEHYQAGRYVEATKLSQSITQEFPKHKFGWKVLGAALKQMGKINESLIVSQKSVQLDPQDAEAHSNLGVILKELGRLEEAERSCKKAITLKPDLAQAHNNLGNTLKELDRLNEAEASYRQAITLKPDYVDAHYNLGNTLQELGKLDEAEASYRQAITLKPDLAQAYNNLGNTLQELGKLDEAEASYRQAITLKPDYVDAHYNLGNTLQELGKLDETEACYRKVIALKPDKFANAYDKLGVILQKKGESKEAEMCYKKYQFLAPNKLSLTKSRGEILFNQGDFEKALLIFDSYDNITSRARILETLYALGRVDEVYERMDSRADLDDQNLQVAAFAAFLAEREKKDTSHRFCNNPIEFIHFTNISSHIKEHKRFITSLIDELRYIKTRWEINTTKKGFQASINVFANPLEKMSILKSIIIDEINNYYSKFKNKSCSYITKWPSEINIKGWHVILKQQGHQTGHIHPDGWLSGVIYLKVVPSLGKDEGAIEFTLDGPNYLDVNSPRKKYQPRLGDIVFFPSSLHHRTLPFSTDMDRICISFDLMPPQ